MSPTYKNVTSQKQAINGKVIEPGQVICTTAYYNENEVKLLKIDDAPFYNPILMSEVVIGQGTIKIPEKDSLGERVTKYAIHFFLEKGEIEIFYNSTNNKPALKLYPGCKWNLRCFERTIDKIIINANQNFMLWIIVEKL